MTRKSRTMDWGFPRWRAYGAEREAAKVRLCDVDGCGQPGDYPAPKSSYSKERWHFCQEHVTEYNKNWDYFAGLSDEEAKARAEEETRGARGFRQSAHWAWAEAGPDGLTPADRDAYRVLGLEPSATPAQVKSAYRKLAKANHPDTNGGDAAATAKFHAVKAAYERLSARPSPAP
jgi:hypothetical protein